MSTESCRYYLTLLNLTPIATDDEIRVSITSLIRLWTKRTNAPALEARQEAERMILTLEKAESFLLGPMGEMYRSRQTTDKPAQETVVADERNICETLDKVLSAGGTRSQERVGTLLVKRTKLFLNGVDCLREEESHKTYEKALDTTRYQVRQGDLVLFESVQTATESSAQRHTGSVCIPGPWLEDLYSAAKSVLP